MNIEQLVNRQVLKWQEEARIAARPEEERAVQRPMITITREYGAGGSAIGRAVAERLGFHFYAQDLVEQIAQLAHVRRAVIESVDERTQDAIDEFLGELYGGEYLSTSEYFRNLCKVVATLGRHGKGVIIGRGAQFILQPERTLRIRAFAPLEVRVKRISERRGLSEEEARAEAHRVDAERRSFYRKHFDRDVTDPASYDLLFNTGTLSLETCADLVVSAFRARFRE